MKRNMNKFNDWVFAVLVFIIIFTFLSFPFFNSIKHRELSNLVNTQTDAIYQLYDKTDLLVEQIKYLQEINIEQSKINKILVDENKEIKEQISKLNEKVDWLYDNIIDVKERFEVIEITWKELNFDRFIATAYSPFDNVSGIENDGNPWSTSTGSVPDWGTFAVCPETIPYHSKVTVIGEDYVEHGKALDTGGTMRRFGTWIDLYRDTYQQTLEFGLQRDVIVIWQEPESEVEDGQERN